jgi:hypothetical protein
MMNILPRQSLVLGLSVTAIVAGQSLTSIAFAQAITISNTWQVNTPVDPPWMQRALELQNGAIRGEAMDEPMGGKTLQGTPVTPRVPECFPAESRDLFWQMDMVPDATRGGQLHSLNFDINNDGVIDDRERNAIRGRNTWVMWCGGNEGFWDWLTQKGYGITDFLILLDSRGRTNRFQEKGLINQPGFKANYQKNSLGLYLDVPEVLVTNNQSTSLAILRPPPWEKSNTSRRAPHPEYQLFKVGDPKLYKDAITMLEAMGDGVDYSVYGYSSGVVGLRLFPNPDFFGDGDLPKAARARWKEKVQNKTDDSYYTNLTISQDPTLIRPFRVGMSCGFCHVGPHPLNPPKNFEVPEWANLSTTIGNQFWKPQPAFGVLLRTNNFVHHFLASQQPGTIDTSLVSSDQINNANTINAIFNVNARLARAMVNPTERQSSANVVVRSIEDDGLPIKGDGSDWRHTPRVLLDGSDSIGVFGALARVYLNIGTFYEQWARCDNLVIGFSDQRPFQLDVCQHNSVYWLANERFRAGYLAAFFTMAYPGNVQKRAAKNNYSAPCESPHTSTQPMKLMTAKIGDAITANPAAEKYLALDDPTNRISGRRLWLKNCAICHSSKQPEGFQLSFERKSDGAQWFDQPAPRDPKYVLPLDAADWDAYKRSPSYLDYVSRIEKLVGTNTLNADPLTDNHPFWQDNYLSTDIRVPVTLTSTPSGRAMASNGLKGHIWDNFSSDTYKELPAVGPVAYVDPISGRECTYDAAGGGRGYYRPATLVSLWATAPFLHNNALGVYLNDPSVEGRLIQFTDAIRRLLWKDKRAQRSLLLSAKEQNWKAVFAQNINMQIRKGDLRDNSAFKSDTGFIYRVPNDTQIEIAPGFIRQLVLGLAGPIRTAVLTTWLWIVLALLAAWLAWKAAPRYLGIVLVGLALLILLPLAMSGMGGRASGLAVLLMEIGSLVPLKLWGWRLVVLTFAAAGVVCIEARNDSTRVKPRSTANLVALILIGGVGLAFLVSEVYRIATVLLILALAVAIIPRFFEKRWTLSQFSRIFFVLLTVAAVLGGIAANRFINGRALLSIPVFNIKIGPLPLAFGPIPMGTPVNLIMNMDPDSPNLPASLASTVLAVAEIKQRQKELKNEDAWRLFSMRAGKALMNASKCPDFTLDRGHYFGETLDSDPEKNEQAKEDLIAFLKTL